MYSYDLVMIKKKIKGEDYSLQEAKKCRECNENLSMSDVSQMCENCGSIYQDNDLKMEDYFREQPNSLNMNRLYWATQRYDSSFARDYSIRRYIQDLAQKIDFPENLRTKTEALVKIILTKLPTLSRNLKSLCYVCSFIKLRTRDPSYSIKNFSEICGMKPKNIIKYMNEIKPFTFDTDKMSSTVQSGNELTHDTEHFKEFLNKIDFAQIFNTDANLALSLFKSQRKVGADNTIQEHPIYQDDQLEKMQERIKSKILKYGTVLLQDENFFPIKYGKKFENYASSIVFIICKAFNVPITMKKLSEITDVSHIAISRISKELSDLLISKYQNFFKVGSKLKIDNFKKDEEDEEEISSGKGVTKTNKYPTDLKSEKNLKKALKYILHLDQRKNDN